MDRDEFVRIMAVLSAGIGREFPREQAAAWFECLGDLQPDQLKRAVKTWLCSHDSGFPSIAAIRRLATEAEHGQHAGWQDAWAQVMQAVRVWSEHDREAAMTARAMLGQELYAVMYAVTGGFYNLALADAGQLAVWESHFRDAWTRDAQRASTMLALPEELRPEIQRIGCSVEEARDQVAPTRPAIAGEERKRLAVYVGPAADKLGVPAEPKSEPDRIRAKDRPPSLSKEEQLRRLRKGKPA